MAIRTLPLRPEPIAGEAIDSWLEILAHRYDVTWSEFRRQALGSVRQLMVMMLGMPAWMPNRMLPGLYRVILGS